ncbi:hypothetical protein ACI5KX_01070 [Erythrobacter sp. GH1-10]|uniref:hypothetical protein n=1 Tax=Erythrobacter sp. GH1-10 TaxID=3349334 RepID=UPI003877B512
MFGRGPLFWGAMVALTTALVVALAATGSIEGKAPLLLLALVPCILAMIMFRAGYKAADDPESVCGGTGEAQKRYIKRTAIFTSLYLATFGLLVFADLEFRITREVRFALALLPGLAITGVFWTIGRLIVEETDEFIRMLVIRQTLIASAIALTLATVWGFLESADVVPHLDAYWWAVAFFAGLFVGAVVNRIEHGTWGAV